MKYPLWKKIFDVLGSLLGLILISPFVPLIGLLIKLESEGPVIEKLDRVSGGKTVKVYKFRSMVVGASTTKEQLEHLNERKDGPLFKIKHDPRVTGKIGRFLRKTRLDEFPQLINVLKGEIALVGPRPREPKEAKMYPVEYKKILEVRNGVTGLSQVNGASSLPFLEELKLDKFYIENSSFWLDLKIVLKTLAILFFDSTAV